MSAYLPPPKRPLTKSQQLSIQLVWLYKIVRGTSDSLLLSVFGVSIGCKHLPTCSEYTITQIQKHGTISGLLKGGYRILTCW